MIEVIDLKLIKNKQNTTPKDRPFLRAIIHSVSLIVRPCHFRSPGALASTLLAEIPAAKTSLCCVCDHFTLH